MNKAGLSGLSADDLKAHDESMAGGNSKAEMVCAEVLKGLDLDEETLAYLAGGVVAEDTGFPLPKDDLIDFVAPFLEESCGGDEAKAQELAAAIHDRLIADPAAAKAAAEAAEEPAEIMLAPIKMLSADMHAVPDGLKELFPELAGSGAYVHPDELKVQERERRPGARGKAEAKVAKADAKEAKVFNRKAEVSAARTAELSEQVDVAREQAVLLRAEKGLNFNDAIKVGPFDLPHPAGGRPLLEDATFALTPGRRYGLVGRNGKGKSTLLRNLAARRVGDLKETVAVHYVSQDVSFSAATMEQTPGEVVVEADVERKVLLEKTAALQERAEGGEVSAEDNALLRACLGQLEAIGAESAQSRATVLLTKLGFSEELRGRQLKALSGGWRVRVALAAALFARPDVLMLDEPTNHLSMQAVLWLIHELCNNPIWRARTIMVVSHDRYFIDSTCTDILHLSGIARRVTHHKCDYTAWERSRAEQQQMKAQQIRDAGKAREHWMKYVRSGQAAAGNVSSTSRLKKVKELDDQMAKQAEELAALEEDRDLPLRLAASPNLGVAAVTLSNAGFGYPDSPILFRKAGVLHKEFTVNSDSRIVLVGENGNGKTTLVKLLLGQLEPTEGRVDINRQARFALVNQHHADMIDLRLSPMQFMKQKFPGNSSVDWECQIATHLEQCGVMCEQLNVAASALSGGQRSRLAMASVSFAEPHVLFLDEPTNNLDLGSVEALAEAVENFEGGVVLVSHDQHFVSRVAKEVWLVGNGAVTRQESFEAYRAHLLAQAVPGSDVAAEAIEAFVQKKLLQSGGQVSRVALAKEKAELLKSPVPT